MRKHLLTPATGFFLLSMSACAQEGGSSVDDDLLAQQSIAPSGTVPVLAWRSGNNLHLQSATVTAGTFPAAFRLGKPTTPPPAETLRTDSILPMGAHAVATIGALPSGFPAQLTASKRTTSTNCGLFGGAPDPEACTDKVEACMPDGSGCAKMELTCNSSQENCTVTKIDGDAALLNTLRQRLPDRSREHSVLYVPEAAAAGSALSQTYNGGAPVAAGFHLLENLEPSAADFESFTKCLDQVVDASMAELGKPVGRTFDNPIDLVTALALQKYNAKHGTSHATAESIRSEPDYLTFSAEADAELEAALAKGVVAKQCLVLARYYEITGFDARYVSFGISGPAPAPKVGDVFKISPARESEDTFGSFGPLF